MSRQARILVIVGETALRDQLWDSLEILGYHVLPARDPVEGEALLAQEHPDLVLSDLSRPGLPGAEVIRRLVALSPSCPVVVMAGIAEVQDALEGGASDCVVTPLPDVRLLEMTLRRTLENARLREENRRHREELEGLVRQRTEELRASEEQLRQSQKLEAVGLLAGGLAHDVNNMLTAIMGHADLLRARLGPGHALQVHVSEMEKAVTRSRGIIRQLLAFARRQDAEPCLLDLNRHVAELRRVLAPLIGEDVALEFKPCTDLARIRFDPSHLDQVVVNLVVNACDAMPQGGSLTIETAEVVLDGEAPDPEPAGWYVVLSVSDSGTGMDEETLARVFEPFFTTKAQGRGTGLGLSTVFGIVRQGGGFMRVRSARGRGSTFSVFLPAVAETQEEPAAARPATVVGASAVVLVVEDDPILRDVLPLMLAPVGYQVEVATTPFEALEWCRDAKRSFDLLLTDVVMPGMSGVELVEKVLEDRPGLPVLLMSGHTPEAVARRGGFKEGRHYIQKPFTSTELALKVASTLKGEDEEEVPG